MSSSRSFAYSNVIQVLQNRINFASIYLGNSIFLRFCGALTKICTATITNMNVISKRSRRSGRWKTMATLRKRFLIEFQLKAKAIEFQRMKRKKNHLWNCIPWKQHLFRDHLWNTNGEDGNYFTWPPMMRFRNDLNPYEMPQNVNH